MIGWDHLTVQVNYSTAPKALTVTQVEIMDALIQGRTIKQISTARKISRRTVVQHLCDVRERLGARTRDQAVYMFAIRYAKMAE